MELLTNQINQVSLCCWLATEGALLQVIGFIIRFAILPQSPQDSEPTVRQDAVGVSVPIAMGANLLPVRRRPTQLELRLAQIARRSEMLLGAPVSAPAAVGRANYPPTVRLST